MAEQERPPARGEEDVLSTGDARPAGRPVGDGLLFGRVLVALTRVVLRFPVATLAIALGLTAASLALTLTSLGYKSSRLDLLNPKNDYNRLWIEYINEFGDDDDAVIVVEGLGRDEVIPVLVDLSSALGREKRLFHAILHEVDLSRIRAKGLHYLQIDELHAIDRYLNEAIAITGGQWAQLQMGKLLGRLTAAIQLSASGRPGIDRRKALGDLNRLAESLLAEFSSEPRYQSPWPGMPGLLATVSELQSGYLIDNGGQFGFVLLRLAVDKQEFTRGSEAVDALRQLIAQTQARYPDVKIGLTGLPIMENDEMRASQSSMFWASTLSLIGVAIVVVAGFGGVRHALMANLVLLVGMAWAFGYVTLAVGHLNILSVTFAVTLIGLGIDYGTYYISRYMHYRRQGMDCTAALLETTDKVGPGIFTGAVTTSVAFFAAGLTSFVGVSELGIIAGGGILLCALAQLLVLPALVHVVDHSRFAQAVPVPVPVQTWINPLLRAPRVVLTVAVAAMLVASLGMRDLWYDHNLLNLQPQGLESVELEKKLLADCDQSVWYALSIADSRDELLRRKEKFQQLPSVERTQEIASLIPGDHELKRPIIARIGARLSSLPERPPQIGNDPIEELGSALAKAQQLAASLPEGAACARQLELLRDAMRRRPASECYEKISQFQYHMAGDLLSRMHALRAVANPEPPTLDDLPAGLVDRFVGQNGKHLLKIYGRGDIWNMDSLKKFVHEVRSVDPRATGNPLQAYEASLEMKSSFEQAAIYAFLVIVGVLYADFRNLKYSIMAMLPLVLGLVCTFGLLGYLDQPLNPANLIALPLLMGIGIDYGVHIVHEFMEQTGRYRLSAATAVAVAVDALTTIIGFGSLMIASHQGLQSLGRVLTIGVTSCTIMSLICLPALLTWMTRNRPLVPWVGNAVESYAHGNMTTDDITVDGVPELIGRRQAA